MISQEEGKPSEENKSIHRADEVEKNCTTKEKNLFVNFKSSELHPIERLGNKGSFWITAHVKNQITGSNSKEKRISFKLYNGLPLV